MDKEKFYIYAAILSKIAAIFIIIKKRISLLPLGHGLQEMI